VSAFGRWHNCEPDFILPSSNPENILPAVRDFLSHHPTALGDSPRRIAILMWLGRFTPYPPADADVEAALEILQLEGKAA
jgi:hypothetical protein